MGWKAYHVCDRCKKEYVEDEYKGSVVSISKRTAARIKFQFSAREANDPWGRIVNIDLCLECRKSLYKFLKGEEIPT